MFFSFLKVLLILAIIYSPATSSSGESNSCILSQPGKTPPDLVTTAISQWAADISSLANANPSSDFSSGFPDKPLQGLVEFIHCHANNSLPFPLDASTSLSAKLLKTARTALSDQRTSSCAMLLKQKPSCYGTVNASYATIFDSWHGALKAAGATKGGLSPAGLLVLEHAASYLNDKAYRKTKQLNQSMHAACKNDLDGDKQFGAAIQRVHLNLNREWACHFSDSCIGMFRLLACSIASVQLAIVGQDGCSSLGVPGHAQEIDVKLGRARMLSVSRDLISVCQPTTSTSTTDATSASTPSVSVQSSTLIQPTAGTGSSTARGDSTATSVTGITFTRTTTDRVSDTVTSASTVGIETIAKTATGTITEPRTSSVSSPATAKTSSAAVSLATASSDASTNPRSDSESTWSTGASLSKTVPVTTSVSERLTNSTQPFSAATDMPTVVPTTRTSGRRSGAWSSAVDKDPNNTSGRRLEQRMIMGVAGHLYSAIGDFASEDATKAKCGSTAGIESVVANCPRMFGSFEFDTAYMRRKDYPGALNGSMIAGALTLFANESWQMNETDRQYVQGSPIFSGFPAKLQKLAYRWHSESTLLAKFHEASRERLKEALEDVFPKVMLMAELLNQSDDSETGKAKKEEYFRTLGTVTGFCDAIRRGSSSVLRGLHVIRDHSDIFAETLFDVALGQWRPIVEYCIPFAAIAHVGIFYASYCDDLLAREESMERRLLNQAIDDAYEIQYYFELAERLARSHNMTARSDCHAKTGATAEQQTEAILCYANKVSSNVKSFEQARLDSSNEFYECKSDTVSDTAVARCARKVYGSFEINMSLKLGSTITQAIGLFVRHYSETYNTYWTIRKTPLLGVFPIRLMKLAKSWTTASTVIMAFINATKADLEMFQAIFLPAAEMYSYFLAKNASEDDANVQGKLENTRANITELCNSEKQSLDDGTHKMMQFAREENKLALIQAMVDQGTHWRDVVDFWIPVALVVHTGIFRAHICGALLYGVKTESYEAMLERAVANAYEVQRVFEEAEGHGRGIRETAHPQCQAPKETVDCFAKEVSSNVDMFEQAKTPNDDFYDCLSESETYFDTAVERCTCKIYGLFEIKLSRGQGSMVTQAYDLFVKRLPASAIDFLTITNSPLFGVFPERFSVLAKNWTSASQNILNFHSQANATFQVFTETFLPAAVNYSIHSQSAGQEARINILKICDAEKQLVEGSNAMLASVNERGCNITLDFANKGAHWRDVVEFWIPMAAIVHVDIFRAHICGQLLHKNDTAAYEAMIDRAKENALDIQHTYVLTERYLRRNASKSDVCALPVRV